MDAWCEALGQIDPAQIRVALENVMTAHPNWPPTLGEFVTLCKPVATPRAHRPYLPAPRDGWKSVDPKIRAAIDELTKADRKRDPKDWARRIMADHECGEKLLLIQLQFAREALGLAEA